MHNIASVWNNIEQKRTCPLLRPWAVTLMLNNRVLHTCTTIVQSHHQSAPPLAFTAPPIRIGDTFKLPQQQVKPCWVPHRILPLTLRSKVFGRASLSNATRNTRLRRWAESSMKHWCSRQFELRYKPAFITFRPVGCRNGWRSWTNPAKVSECVDRRIRIVHRERFPQQNNSAAYRQRYLTQINSL